uniref:Uncharacterized protein n=1 Tax=Kalanchoe fedtschenkoi TaxID=63787 RepID=A0A7N0T6N1_KALFE
MVPITTFISAVFASLSFITILPRQRLSVIRTQQQHRPHSNAQPDQYNYASYHFETVYLHHQGMLGFM